MTPLIPFAAATTALLMTVGGYAAGAIALPWVIIAALVLALVLTA
jgi:hypothetical protein